VIAGGLGSMAPALALARDGIDVQIYEQAQQLTEASADLSLAPNGLRMLSGSGSARGSGEWPHGTGWLSCCSPAGSPPGTSLISS
jgi:3-hydroxybenzoate 6-monooxygenase